MGKKAGPSVFLPRPPACLKLFAEESFDIAGSTQKLEEEAEFIQSRLRAILTQVWDENATFQRIMYKNQNQHRRTVYFRRLLQVRRDLLLLQSFRLKDVVETLTHCVSFSKQQKGKALPPKAVLGSLGLGLESKEHLSLAVQRRLLGAARLLHLMAEPILSASSVIAGLLSQSFFMPFALTMLALLARFRVLLVQALYEMIVAFNLVSAFVQKMETLSAQPHVPLFLECSWDGVKLEFLEKMPPPPPPPPPQELIPLLTCLSDAGKLPDAGWFVDDRSILVKEKLQSTAGVLEPVLYEREESFILEDSQFELLGGEEDVVETADISVEPVPTPISAIARKEAEEVSSDEVGSLRCSQEMSLTTGIPVEAIPTPSLAISNGEADGYSGIHEMARSLSTDREAELESLVSKEADKLVEEPYALDENTKKRVAYVSVQIGGAKESKIMKIEHQM